jgi:methyltransferase (TIGR00027 family)
MKKIGTAVLDGLEKTALLPLYIRAVEARRSHPLIRDDRALKMVESIDFDFSSLRIPSVSAVPSLLRVRQFDRMADSFLCRHPRTVVVNLGCGLDTRFFRVDNGIVRWYELDLPGVIALRRNFFRENNRYRFLACSVLDFDWMETVTGDGQSYLFLAEGVLMYLSQEEVRNLVFGLSEQFPGSELIFDAASLRMVKMSRRHPSLKSVGAAMKWGIRKSAELESWKHGISLLEEWFYYDTYELRLGWENIFRFFPPVRDLFRILRYKLDSPPSTAERAPSANPDARQD